MFTWIVWTPVNCAIFLRLCLHTILLFLTFSNICFMVRNSDICIVKKDWNSTLCCKWNWSNQDTFFYARQFCMLLKYAKYTWHIYIHNKKDHTNFYDWIFSVAIVIEVYSYTSKMLSYFYLSSSELLLNKKW